jgi:hypothetical protein
MKFYDPTPPLKFSLEPSPPPRFLAGIMYGWPPLVNKFGGFDLLRPIEIEIETSRHVESNFKKLSSFYWLSRQNFRFSLLRFLKSSIFHMRLGHVKIFVEIVQTNQDWLQKDVEIESLDLSRLLWLIIYQDLSSNL